MILYLHLDDYLAQWFVNNMGGGDPVSLSRGSIESTILEQFLTTPPDGYTPQSSDDDVRINIPAFRSKDTRYNFYLPPKATELLKTCIRNRFDLVMWDELHRFANIALRQDEIIYAFMEKHGIELSEKNWNAIAKRYQRKRDIYRKKVRRSSKNTPT